MLDSWPQSARAPRALRLLERVEGLPICAVADRMHRDGKPKLGGAHDQLGEFVLARDLDARSVEPARRLGTERSIHERLDVAEPQQLVAETGAERQSDQSLELVAGMRFPDADRERSVGTEALEDGERTEPAVFVVQRSHAPGVRELHRGARGLDELVLGRTRVDVAEAPRALLAQDAARLTAFVPLDDAARNLQVAVGECERRRVQPERMAVPRLERNGTVAADRVEILFRRFDRGRPVAAPPAAASQPPSSRLAQRLLHARESFLQ